METILKLLATVASWFKPSPQQMGLFQWIREGTGSAIVNAVAGSGKTTTLIQAIRFMTGDVCLVAFNKAIALEFDRKLGEAGLVAKAGTAHSFGYGVWARACGVKKLDVDDRKKWDTICERVGVPAAYSAFCKKLVSIAKQSGVGITWKADDINGWYRLVDHYGLDYELADDTNQFNGNLEAAVEQGIILAQQALEAGIELARGNKAVVDFDDMIFMPLYSNCRFYQYDWVLVDEAQDTNVLRRLQYKAMLKPGGRAIYVGDPKQAIYGFTGADSDALELCKAQHEECIELPLSVTYRCPKSVASLVRSLVPCFEAHEKNGEGVIMQVSSAQFERDYVDTKLLTAKDAILCRNTKPIVALAFSLIRRGIACHVEGREIGAGLARLAQRWRVKTVETLRARLDEYLEKEVKKLVEKKQEAKAEALDDKVQTLKVIMDSLPVTATVEDLVLHINRIFGDMEPGKPSPNLTLSTIHKAKGREWRRVFLYAEELIPSRFAVQDWQKRQEENLLYVAWTRTLEQLVRVSG